MRRSALSALLLLMGGCADDEGVCLVSACVSGANVQLAGFSESDLMTVGTHYAEIEVCFNEVCTNLFVEALPGPEHPVYLNSQVAMPAPWLQVDLSQEVAGGDVLIWVGYDSYDADLFHDGDVVTVAVTSGDGRDIAHKTYAIAYHVTPPRNPRCDQACKSTDNVTEL